MYYCPECGSSQIVAPDFYGPGDDTGLRECRNCDWMGDVSQLEYEQMVFCSCDSPYLGAQPIGTPTKCERCRRLVAPDD
jgi:hypothetical protein